MKVTPYSKAQLDEIERVVLKMIETRTQALINLNTELRIIIDNTIDAMKYAYDHIEVLRLMQKDGE